MKDEDDSENESVDNDAMNNSFSQSKGHKAGRLRKDRHGKRDVKKKKSGCKC